MKNSTWVFVFQKYGKFWSVLLGHFINHKPLIYEECLATFYILFHAFLMWLLPSHSVERFDHLPSVHDICDFDTNGW